MTYRPDGLNSEWNRGERRFTPPLLSTPTPSSNPTVRTGLSPFPAPRKNGEPPKRIPAGLPLRRVLWPLHFARLNADSALTLHCGLLTVTVVVPETPAMNAVMAAVPGLTPMTLPEAETNAT